MSRTLRKKYNPSEINSSRASIFYLYEVYAIPEEIRQEYLNKLLNRKNSENQKNVRLLKIIYNKVEQEDFYSWNVGNVCNSAGFKTANQLYWYKSKILKDLREMYFGWKEIEKKLEKNSKGMNKIEKLSVRAGKMKEMGMIKEAKKIFLYVSNIYDCSVQKNFKKVDYLILSEIYENLLNYYSSKKDIRRFDIFSKKLGNLYNSALKDKSLSNKMRALIKIRVLKGEDSRISFHLLSPSHTEEKIRIVKEILYLSEKFNFLKYRISALSRMTSVILVNFSHSAERKKEAYKYLQEGLRLSKQHGLKEQENAFRSEILLGEFESQKERKEEKETALLKELYEKNKNINPAGEWTVKCLDVYVASLAHFKGEKYGKIIDEFTKLKILQSQISSTVFYLYIAKSSSEKSNLINLSMKQVNKSNLLVQCETDNAGINKAEALSQKVIKILGNTYMQNVRAFVLLDLLYFEFLKGKNFNLDNVYSLIRKLHRVRKTNELVNSMVKNSFELLKTGIYMFEESQKYNAKEKVLNIYQKKFSDLCDEIMRKDYYHFNVGYLYLYMTYIAHSLGYREIWNVVEKQWHYLQKHHPAIVESFMKVYHEQQEKRKAA